MINKTVMPALAALLLLTAGSAAATEAAVTLDAERLDQALGEILLDLARLEGVSESPSQVSCRRMHGDIARLRRDVAQLQAEIREGNSGSFSVSIEVSERGRRRRGEGHSAEVEVTPPVMIPVPVAAPAAPPPEPEVVESEPAPPAPISSSDFRRLVARIEAEDFSSGQLRVLDDAADYAWLSSAQVVQILGLFDFSSDQLEALELIARNIVDPENAFEIYGAFTFDSDKEKARQILRSAR